MKRLILICTGIIFLLLVGCMSKPEATGTIFEGYVENEWIIDTIDTPSVVLMSIKDDKEKIKIIEMFKGWNKEEHEVPNERVLDLAMIVELIIDDNLIIEVARDNPGGSLRYAEDGCIYGAIYGRNNGSVVNFKYYYLPVEFSRWLYEQVGDKIEY